MKHYIDGDQVVVTKDDFIDLQASPAVFILAESETGKTIVAEGVIGLPLVDLISIKSLLDRGGGVYKD
jgi:hypothetical protein